MSLTTGTLSWASPQQGTALRESEATLGRSVTHSHGQDVLVAFPPPPPASHCSNAFTLFWTSQSAIQNQKAELKTLSNRPKLLIWLVRLGLPAECSTAALPQQRQGGCIEPWARGGGVWLALARGKKKTCPQKPEGHTWSVPKWATTAEDLEQLSSLKPRVSVGKLSGSFTENITLHYISFSFNPKPLSNKCIDNLRISHRYCPWKTEQLSLLHFIFLDLLPAWQGCTETQHRHVLCLCLKPAEQNGDWLGVFQANPAHCTLVRESGKSRLGLGCE